MCASQLLDPEEPRCKTCTLAQHCAFIGSWASDGSCWGRRRTSGKSQVQIFESHSAWCPGSIPLARPGNLKHCVILCAAHIARSDCEDIIEDEMNEWLQEASKACHDPSGEDGFLIKQVAREDDPGCVEIDWDEEQSWLPWEQITGLCDNFQDACSTLLNSTASIPRPTFRAVRD